MNTNPETDTRAKVLVVDDEPMILMMLKKFLQPAGYDVQTAQSGRDGLNAFRQEPWDLVTLDRAMPEMNGEEVAAKMRNMAPQVPIILITGFPDAVMRPELFDAILAKPFRPAELLQCVAQALDKRPGGASQPSQARMAKSDSHNHGFAVEASGVSKRV